MFWLKLAPLVTINMAGDDPTLYKRESFLSPRTQLEIVLTDLSFKVCSGFMLTSVKTQSCAVVTSMAAFSLNS